MFARILAVVLATILLLTVGFGAIGAFAMRQERTSARLEALTAQAREIAWLAASDSTSPFPFFSSVTGSRGNYLEHKAREVYDTYGAYIMVVDRYGRVMDNLSTALREDPDFATSLNRDELGDELSRVLQGEEVILRTQVQGASIFTVGVPYVRSEQVLGAVLIRTPAQQVEGSVWEFILPVAGIALGVFLLATLILSLYLRRVMKPLRTLTAAADAMAGGDFSLRVQQDNASPEVGALASAFNTMSEKLADIERSRREFVANVSHELRSPLTSINGFVQGMEDGTIPPEEHGKYLHIVAEEGQRLSRLVGDLLALSRLERDDAALELSDFDLCELMRRAVIRRVNDLEAKRIEPTFDFDPDPCPVTADRGRIEEVVVNLMDNAIKFTPEGGHITLRIRQEKKKVTAEVQDNGIGIREEDLPRVFDRFFTADRAHTSGKGTGLGLSICQRVLEMHGERIWVSDTREGEGTTFSFTLPAA